MVEGVSEYFYRYIFGNIYRDLKEELAEKQKELVILTDIFENIEDIDKMLYYFGQMRTLKNVRKLRADEQIKIFNDIREYYSKIRNKIVQTEHYLNRIRSFFVTQENLLTVFDKDLRKVGEKVHSLSREYRRITDRKLELKSPGELLKAPARIKR